MKNIIFLTFLFIFSCNSQENTLPNVIIIFADDLGYNDISFHGTSDISTPNIVSTGASSSKATTLSPFSHSTPLLLCLVYHWPTYTHPLEEPHRNL